MSDSGKAGSGRGNSRRRPFKRRDHETRQEDDNSRRPTQGGRGKNNNHQENSSNNLAPRNSAPNASGSSGQDKKGRGGRYRGGRSSRNQGASGRAGENYRGEKLPHIERPKWTPPKMNTDPLPVPDCSWCGKPIRDISQAISDIDTDLPVHFDCVTAKLAAEEKLEKGDVISYIGGGRFGIVNFIPRTGPRPSPDANNGFKIKKIIEWENKDKRADWRFEICDHYSVT